MIMKTGLGEVAQGMRDIRLSQEKYQKNLAAIGQAKPGSDLHGVLEKTAFNIGLLTGNPDNVKNWLNAHVALASYTSLEHASFRDESLDFSLPPESRDQECLSQYLKDGADWSSKDFKRFSLFFGLDRAPSDFDFWMYAQDKLARNVAKRFCES